MLTWVDVRRPTGRRRRPGLRARAAVARLAADALAARAARYRGRGRRRDARFEPVDALLTAEPSPSLVHLSLAPAPRRGWGRPYAGRRPGADRREGTAGPTRPPADAPAGCAVDVSAWPRCETATSPERAFHYSPTRHLSGEPVVSGWAYQWIVQVQVRLTRESWTAPVDVQRLRPAQTASALAVEQLKAFVARRPAAGADPAPPLFLFDAGYRTLRN